MELEMQMNTQKQIIDEKTQVSESRGRVPYSFGYGTFLVSTYHNFILFQESESLSRLLKVAETRIAEAEVRYDYMIDLHLFTCRKK